MPIPPLIDGRGDVHPDESSPHTDCPDPATCDCDCHGCKRAWERAGRPSPSPREIGATADTTITSALVAMREAVERGSRVTVLQAFSNLEDAIRKMQAQTANSTPKTWEETAKNMRALLMQGESPEIVLAMYLGVWTPGICPKPVAVARAIAPTSLAAPVCVAWVGTNRTCDRCGKDKDTHANPAPEVDSLTTARNLLRRARIRLVDEPSAKELDAEIVAFLGKCPGATTNGSQRCTREQGHKGRCFDGKRVFADETRLSEASYAEARDAQKFKE